MLSGSGPDAMELAPKLQRASKGFGQGAQCMSRSLSASCTGCYASLQVSSVSNFHHRCLYLSDSWLVSTAQEDVHLSLAFLRPARDQVLTQLHTPVQAATESYADASPACAAQMGMAACQELSA